MLLLLGLALCAAALPLQESINYERFENNEVLRITPTSEAQLTALLHLRQNLTISLGLDWWEEPSRVNRAADLRITPINKHTVEQYLQAAGISWRVMIDNVQALVDEQLRAVASRSKNNSAFEFGQYHDLDEITEFLYSLPTTYPNLASVFSIARSYQGRDLTVVKITGKDSGSSKPGFWIDGGIHAREWISPATVLYVLNELLVGYETDPSITLLVDSFDFYFLPVFNVDGYVYTWTNNRMWRKTRSRNVGSSCIGTDPNRNYPFHWGEIGASDNPCDETFYGASPLSEVETKGVADYLETIPDLAAYFNVHSYSQLWLSPWGYTNAKPVDYETQIELSEQAVSALEAVYGTQYEYGSSYSTVYPTSGGIDDWTYGALNVVYSYCIELRDTGRYGFLLPENQIIPSGIETFAGLKVSMEYVLAHHRQK